MNWIPPPYVALQGRHARAGAGAEPQPEAKIMNAPPTLPPAVVITLWNTVAEDTGTLTETLCKFAALILEAAANHPAIPDSSRNT